MWQVPLLKKIVNHVQSIPKEDLSPENTKNLSSIPPSTSQTWLIPLINQHAVQNPPPSPPPSLVSSNLPPSPQQQKTPTVAWPPEDPSGHCGYLGFTSYSGVSRQGGSPSECVKSHQLYEAGCSQMQRLELPHSGKTKQQWGQAAKRPCSCQGRASPSHPQPHPSPSVPLKELLCQTQLC